MFKKHYHKKSSNPLFVIFRLILSLTMFAVLLGGVYTAYKHFSGLDPLKLDPQSVLKNFYQLKTPQQFLSVLSAIKVKPSLPASNQSHPSDLQTPGPANYIFRFLLLADSENDNDDLKKAISQSKTNYPDLSFIIGLGDYTNVGTIEDLKKAKTELDSSGLRYFLIPGDHDLWDSRNRSLEATADYKTVFGPNFQSFTYQNYLFLMIDNSDDYKGLGEAQSKWITGELQKAKENSVKGIYVFIGQPLYHPSSDHVMGKVDPSLKKEAEGLIFELKAAGVKKVFAGDIHYFSEYVEPETNLPMMTVGAVTIDRNPQAPRYAVVSVFADGSTKVEDVEIK